MMRKLTIGVVALFAVGCSQESSTMTKTDQNTLQSNLNSPVDVAKVRAEYNKAHPAETGPQRPNDSM
jgi:PBP1b-binding outer membrane lipoprotein LpoB